LAQTANSANKTFGAGVQNAMVQAAYGEWRKLSQNEITCVDQSLRAHKSNLWFLIQRGIGPSDPKVANVRAGCRTQAKALNHSTVASLASAVQTPSRQYWSFNGSILNLVAEGDSRKFLYFKPHPDLEAAGAKRGALVLEGKVLTLEGNVLSYRFVGTAYHLNSRCGRIPYRVDGTIRDNDHRLELQGQKPRVDASCQVIGTELDALTIKSVDPAFATASNVAPDRAATENVAADPEKAEKAAADKAAADKAAADKAAADKAAAEKAAADKAAADKAAVDKAAAEKATAEKAAADKAAADKAAADKAAAEKATADKAAADKAAANKAAADKAAADKAAANKAAADKAAADKAAADKAAADKAAAEKAAIDKLDAERAEADAIRAQADAERPRQEPEKTTIDAALAYAAAQSRISFVYGLISGPILFSLGGFVFLFLDRKRNIPGARSQAAGPVDVTSRNRRDSAGAVPTAPAQQQRRDRKRPEPVSPKPVTPRPVTNGQSPAGL
jgi:hypothetical protein